MTSPLLRPSALFFATCASGLYGLYNFNGCIPANEVNKRNAAGACTGVCGVPTDYKPAQPPLIPIPANGGSTSDPLCRYYDTNNVWVPLENGATAVVAYNDRLNPWRNQYIPGPLGYALNASAFKTVPVTERASLRINADFFNVLNMAGMPQPGTDGIVQMRNSVNTPRQLQLTIRLTW
jgi:hypothetical protein